MRSFFKAVGFVLTAIVGLLAQRIGSEIGEQYPGVMLLVLLAAGLLFFTAYLWTELGSIAFFAIALAVIFLLVGVFPSTWVALGILVICLLYRIEDDVEDWIDLGASMLRALRPVAISVTAGLAVLTGINHYLQSAASLTDERIYAFESSILFFQVAVSEVTSFRTSVVVLSVLVVGSLFWPSVEVAKPYIRTLKRIKLAYFLLITISSFTVLTEASSDNYRGMVVLQRRAKVIKTFAELEEWPKQILAVARAERLIQALDRNEVEEMHTALRLADMHRDPGLAAWMVAKNFASRMPPAPSEVVPMKPTSLSFELAEARVKLERTLETERPVPPEVERVAARLQESYTAAREILLKSVTKLLTSKSLVTDEVIKSFVDSLVSTTVKAAVPENLVDLRGARNYLGQLEIQRSWQPRTVEPVRATELFPKEEAAALTSRVKSEAQLKEGEVTRQTRTRIIESYFPEEGKAAAEAAIAARIHPDRVIRGTRPVRSRIPPRASRR